MKTCMVAASLLIACALPAFSTAHETPFSLERLRMVPSVMPRAVIDNQIEGWVELSFTVDAAGRTTNVEVTDARPSGVFEQVALTALRQWLWKPVIDAESGRPVEVRSQVRIKFAH